VLEIGSRAGSRHTNSSCLIQFLDIELELWRQIRDFVPSALHLRSESLAHSWLRW
jgi:hypothetical protein